MQEIAFFLQNGESPLKRKVVAMLNCMDAEVSYSLSWEELKVFKLKRCLHYSVVCDIPVVCDILLCANS